MNEHQILDDLRESDRKSSHVECRRSGCGQSLELHVPLARARVERGGQCRVGGGVGGEGGQAGARGEGADGAGGVLAQALAVLAGGAIDAVDARENLAGVAEHARRDTARRAVLARVAGVAPIDTAVVVLSADSMGTLWIGPQIRTL